MTRGALLVAFVAGVLAGPAAADISGHNLLEAQSGNFPFRDPKNRWDVYDQINLDYTFASGRVGLRFEANENSEEQFTYQEFTQRYAEWEDTHLRLRAGNFYTILGRGLVHRSFELPGVVLDQPGLRSRYGPSRDVDGVLVESFVGPVRAKAFAGRPNSGTFSPAAEEFGLERYRGELAGAEAAVEVYRGSRVGATYLRESSAQSGNREFGSGFVEVDPLALAGVEGPALPVYVEYAQANRSFGDWWAFRTGDRDTFALYASTNVLWGPFTLSAEWKEYRGFRTGFSDPPSLVREHPFPLLNRNTHVLDAERERGFQLEGSWTQHGWGTVTVNGSRSDGEGDRFDELYVEAHVAPSPDVWEATVFADGGKDEFDFIVKRNVYGGSGTVRLTDVWAATADIEKQDATRRFFTLPPSSFSDLFVSLEVSRAFWGSAAIVYERSTDPNQEKPEDGLSPGIQPRHFTAVVLNATVDDRHRVTLFMGQRRGGRACTAGTCYDVSPFEGAELRVTTLF